VGVEGYCACGSSYFVPCAAVFANNKRSIVLTGGSHGDNFSCSDAISGREQIIAGTGERVRESVVDRDREVGCFFTCFLQFILLLTTEQTSCG